MARFSLPDPNKLDPSRGDLRARLDARARAALAAPDQRNRIEIQDLDFFYGETQALRQVSIGFQDRRVTALIGPSGCGKSTLIRVLNRLHDLYPGQRAVGRVLLDGADILGPDVDSAAAQNQTKQSPAEFALETGASVAGSLIPLSGLIRKISGAEARQKYANAAVYAGGLRRAYIKGLAKGRGCKI